jgi:hypothetical protein
VWEKTTSFPIKTTIPNDNDIYRAEHQNADIDLSQRQQGGRKNPILNQGYPKSKETIIREREKFFLYS